MARICHFCKQAQTIIDMAQRSREEIATTHLHHQCLWAWLIAQHLATFITGHPGSEAHPPTPPPGGGPIGFGPLYVEPGATGPTVEAPEEPNAGKVLEEMKEWTRGVTGTPTAERNTATGMMIEIVRSTPSPLGRDLMPSEVVEVVMVDDDEADLPQLDCNVLPRPGPKLSQLKEKEGAAAQSPASKTTPLQKPPGITVLQASLFRTAESGRSKSPSHP